MPGASYLQTNFLGGVFSPFTQGRMELTSYRAGLKTSLNFMPLEEGALTRRPGFRRLGYTRSGAYAALKEFHFAAWEQYDLELTAGHLRLWGGSPLGLNSSNLIVSNTSQAVGSISTATPAVITTGTHGWADGDQVIFRQADGATSATLGHLLNRQFTIDVLSTTTFSITDATTGEAFDGNDAGAIPASGLTVARIVDFATPYTAAEVQGVTTVQTELEQLLLHHLHAPRRLFVTAGQTACLNAEFTFTTPIFLDGPYMDPVPTGQTITVSGTGTIDFTISAGTQVLAATDVGRMIRILEQPIPWDATTAFIFNQTVQFGGVGYTCRNPAGVTGGASPDQNTDDWNINVYAFQWLWGYIATVTGGGLTGTITLQDDGVLLYGTEVPQPTWRLGLYSDTTGWPSCGVYHEGRLILASRFFPNRIDGSMSNDPLRFSPTDRFDTVADNNGISYVFQSDEVNPTRWMVVDEQGIVVGTKGGEWLVRPGTSGDSLTPTSVQARKVSKYGTADVLPKRIGTSTVFVDRFDRKLLEYSTEPSAGTAKYQARNMALKAKHLTAAGISEIAYQRELLPVLWARTALGALIGATYKKEEPDDNGQSQSFTAWHHHQHGNGHTFESIQAGPTGQGLDTLMAVTYNADTGYGNDATVSITGLSVSPGDVIEAMVVADPQGVPFFRSPRGVGSGGEALTITGGHLV